jgi:2',3'-cyclic-nucleotide 2'-phosphodiesterase (5'-nucleotidase family)
MDGRTVTVGGAAQLAAMFDEEAASLPGRTLLLAAGHNVGASPPNSGLLQDMPAIDVENAWGLDATSLGNHEFDSLTPIGPADTVRFVTNDFMLTGGDGYTVFAQGTDILQPGDGLLEVTIEYITAHSPVAPIVEGRITRTP